MQGCLTDAQNQQFNTELMDQSQNDAKYVALTRLGYSVPANPVQIRVVEVCRDAPAHGVLETGDQVLAVDGTDVSDVSQIGAKVQAHKPGDSVSVTFDRNGVTHTESITAGKVHTEGSGENAQQSCVPAGGSTTRHRVPRRVVAGVRHLSIPGQREDRHAARRRAVGRPRVHAGDHRRPHAGRRSPAASRSRSRAPSRPTAASARSAASSRRRSPRARTVCNS